MHMWIGKVNNIEDSHSQSQHTCNVPRPLFECNNPIGYSAHYLKNAAGLSAAGQFRSSDLSQIPAEATHLVCE